MSNMAFNYAHTVPRKVAITAIFGDFPLRFIKCFKVMIKCRGAYHESDVLPVFMFMHDQANANSPNAQCHYPSIHALNNPRLGERGNIFVLAPLWGAYE